MKAPKLTIIKAKDRLKKAPSVKMAIFGPPGIGKTRSILTLDHKTTLLVDLEAGTLSIEGREKWKGDKLSARTWEEARDLACLLGGPNPALKNGQPYSFSHYEKVRKENPGVDLTPYNTLFIDSISKVSTFCFQWAQQQPECMKNGRLDTRGAYGLLGREMIAWINQLQYIDDKDIIMVGILEQKLIDDGETTFTKWELQCEGNKTSSELPAIVDELLCLVPKTTSNNKDRGEAIFVCDALNPFGYPAKDRSGNLQMFEEYNLAEVLKKIKGSYEDEEEESVVDDKEEKVEESKEETVEVAKTVAAPDPYIFTFYNDDIKRDVHRKGVLEYFSKIIQSLDTDEKLVAFEKWTDDNKSEINRYYKAEPKDSGIIDMLVSLRKEVTIATE